jgi:hypothetical protein
LNPETFGLEPDDKKVDNINIPIKYGLRDGANSIMIGDAE